jgi:hypothetical protein
LKKEEERDRERLTGYSGREEWSKKRNPMLGSKFTTQKAVLIK